MTLSIGENVTESFEFAKDGLVDHWVRWIILLVITCIPIVNFISSGYLVKIYKGASVAPELEDYVGMFIDGIKLAIVGIGYMIIPLIMIFAAVFVGFTGTLGMLLMLIGGVLVIIFGLAAMIGGIRFAKTDQLGEGFNFGAVFATISEIGWGHYILSYIVFIAVVCIILAILSLIPIVGQVLFLIIMPVILLLQGKFFENLYSRA